MGKTRAPLAAPCLKELVLRGGVGGGVFKGGGDSPDDGSRSKEGGRVEGSKRGSSHNSIYDENLFGRPTRGHFRRFSLKPFNLRH